ncbi:MAG: ABC transporter permease [Bacteroidota bacterium]|jgi:putative ABC transport system permease protein
MFDADKWQEILGTISKNKLRTFLTGFSVAWGIFILIVLLGAGQGLRNGAESQFLMDAVNSVFIGGGTTTLPYQGIKPGRKIVLKTDDYEYLKKNVPALDKMSAISGSESVEVTYKKRHGTFTVRSCMPDHDYLENARMMAGRFINENDIKEYRKVCAIGYPVRDELFKEESPIGKFVSVNGIAYKVIGVFTDPGNGDVNRLYVPLTTFQRACGQGNKIEDIWSNLSAENTNNNEATVTQIRNILAARHHFNPADMSAVSVENWGEEYDRIMNMLDGIKLFIWIIGLFTLLAGIVGVSNIMMIIVKERTNEIGIRKALGATPMSVVMLVVQEAVFITGISGYIGLLLGIVVLNIMNSNLEGDFFKHPSIDFSLAISATLMIIVAGALAGFFPALKAAKVPPVEALRAD